MRSFAQNCSDIYKSECEEAICIHRANSYREHVGCGKRSNQETRHITSHKQSPCWSMSLSLSNTDGYSAIQKAKEREKERRRMSDRWCSAAHKAASSRWWPASHLAHVIGDGDGQQRQQPEHLILSILLRISSAPPCSISSRHLNAAVNIPSSDRAMQCVRVCSPPHPRGNLHVPR